MNFKKYLAVCEGAYSIVESNIHDDIKKLTDELMITYAVNPAAAQAVIKQILNDLKINSTIINEKIDELLSLHNLQNAKQANQLKTGIKKSLNNLNKTQMIDFLNIAIENGLIDENKIANSNTIYSLNDIVTCTKYKEAAISLFENTASITGQGIGEAEYALILMMKGATRGRKNQPDITTSKYAFEIKGNAGTILSLGDEALKLKSYLVREVYPLIKTEQVKNMFTILTTTSTGLLVSYFLGSKKLSYRKSNIGGGEAINIILKDINDETETKRIMNKIFKILKLKGTPSQVITGVEIDIHKFSHILVMTTFDNYKNRLNFTHLVYYSSKKQLFYTFKNYSSFKPIQGLVDIKVKIQLLTGGGRNGVSAELIA